MMNSNKKRATEIKAKCQGRQAESQALPIAKEARRARQKVWINHWRHTIIKKSEARPTQGVRG